MSLLYSKRIILAKKEVTYGTDPNPTGAANAILAKNITIKPQESTMVDREIVRPFFGNSEELQTAINATLEFEVEMAGSGAAGTAPSYGELLCACGLSETVVASTSVTYAPVSDSIDSVSLYFNLDGVLHKLTGARGTVTMAWPLNGIPTFKFVFTGLYNDVVDAAAPTVSLSGFQTPLPVNSINTPGLTVHGFAGAAMSDLSIDMANEVVHRTLVNSDESVKITDRKPTGSVTVEATTMAAKDWFAASKDIGLDSLSIAHGVAAGNIVTFNAPNVQVSKPEYQELDKIAMLQMGLRLLPVDGNDELSIAFT